MQNIVMRYLKNPILTREDVPYPVATVHNAGVVKYKNRYIMLFRAHLKTVGPLSAGRTVRMGLHFKVLPKPFLTPASYGIFAEYEAFGIEDLRINPVDGSYFLTYSAYSRHGVRIALARTDDFKKN